MNRGVVLALVVAASACSETQPEEPAGQPCQNEAQAAIFKAWGVEQRPVTIIWHATETLDCIVENGTDVIPVEPGTGVGILLNGDCVRGFYDPVTNRISLADLPTWSKTLVHELAHVVYGDHDHQLQAAMPSSMWTLIGDAAVDAMECGK